MKIELTDEQVLRMAAAINILKALQAKTVHHPLRVLDHNGCYIDGIPKHIEHRYGAAVLEAGQKALADACAYWRAIADGQEPDMGEG